MTNFDLQSWLASFHGIPPEIQRKLIITAVVLVMLWILRRFTLRIVWKQTEDVNIRYMWRKGSTYAAFVLALIVMGLIWFRWFGSLGTFLGLVSAGLAIALKDLIAGIAGWFFILWRRPFGLGDRIQIGSLCGDVVDIRIFMFTILETGNWVDADQSTGRVIHVPNGMILSTPLMNYTGAFKYIWDELPVLVTFESHWEDAKRILQEIADRHAADIAEEARRHLKETARKYLIRYRKLTPTVYTKVVDSGVLLTIRYLVEPRRRRGTAQAMWEDILRAFATREDIDFAYPTTRFYDNLREGKPGASARRESATDGS